MPTKKEYQVQLTLGDKQYQSKGSTLVEAIENLKLTRFLKTKGVFVAKFGKLKAERLMPIIQMKRVLTGGRMAKEVFAKHTLMLMK